MFYLETVNMIEHKLCLNDHWMVPYKVGNCYNRMVTSRWTPLSGLLFFLHCTLCEKTTKLMKHKLYLYSLDDPFKVDNTLCESNIQDGRHHLTFNKGPYGKFDSPL